MLEYLLVFYRLNLSIDKAIISIWADGYTNWNNIRQIINEQQEE